MLVFWHDLRVSGDTRAIAIGGSLVFASALCYAIYLVGAGGIIGRLGSMRFIAWAMLASTVFVLAQFALDDTAGARSTFRRASMRCRSRWPSSRRCCRPGSSRRRSAASARTTSSLVGSLGPVFTIGLGAMILGEPTHPIQLAGAALVLAGVLLVSLKRASSPTAL